MKKCMILLLMVLLLLDGVATALTGTGYPAWDGSAPVEAFGGKIGTQSLLLPYDETADHSYVSGGYIQACFFAYDEKKENYAEIYLLIPDTVKSGDVLTGPCAEAEMTCVGLYEVFADGSETEHLAGQMSGASYPAGSSYEIKIDDVQKDGTTAKISGSVSAVLVGTQKYDEQTVELKDGQFSFSIDMGQAPTIDPYGDFDINDLLDALQVEDEKKYVKV